MTPSLVLTMRKLLLIILIGLTLAACQPDSALPTDATEGAPAEHNHSQHQHRAINVESFGDNIPTPTISFNIEADAISGWNIHINTTHFEFAPSKVNQDASAGEGHAHIYVDGFKMARIYSSWYHLKKLTPGQHIVIISLNANDHSSLHYQGQAISANQSIQQP
jgi:hypothetical protein